MTCLMKSIFFLLFAAFSGLLCAQTSHILTQGSDYQNDVFFSLEEGVVAEVSGTNWDLAFDVTSPFSAAIRINDGHGRAAVVYPNGDLDDWNAIDTAGFEGWSRLTNGITAWESGALNSNANGDPSDFSWGIYSGPPLHQVVGDSIYLFEGPDDSVTKLRIDNLNNGTWNFTHANLDGSNAASVSIDMSDYAGKNFVYYNFSGEVLDREPLTSEWDFVLTRYVGPTAYGMFPTTGVLLNKERAAAAVPDTPVEWADMEIADWTTDDISVIGNGWKSLVNFQWEVVEDLSYFVSNVEGEAYQIWFTLFEGSSSGITELQVAEVVSAGFQENEPSSAPRIHPNPVAEGFVNLSGAEDFTWADVYDAQGRQVANINLMTSLRWNASGLPTGTYLMVLKNERESHPVTFVKP